MNCNGCLEKLDPYLDRELTDKELGEVRLHLETCPPCEDTYLLLAGLKRLVKVSCDRGTAPDQLRVKLAQILF
jgi:mycothiol system anti-sigma-R factor